MVAAVITLLLQTGALYVDSVLSGRCFVAAEETYCLAGVGAPDAVELPERDQDLVLQSADALRAAIADQPLTIGTIGEPDR